MSNKANLCKLDNFVNEKRIFKSKVLCIFVILESKVCVINSNNGSNIVIIKNQHFYYSHLMKTLNQMDFDFDFVDSDSYWSCYYYQNI